MELRKFCWVGKNLWAAERQESNVIWVSEPITTEDILCKKYLGFFSYENRTENGNCEFMLEIFEGDTLIYHTKNSMSSMTAKIENGKFVGVGPFNTHPLEVYFNAIDFEEMIIDNTLNQ
jgi:hypothetical protein